MGAFQIGALLAMALSTPGAAFQLGALSSTFCPCTDLRSSLTIRSFAAVSPLSLLPVVQGFSRRGLVASARAGADESVTELLEIVSPGLEGQYTDTQRQRIDELLSLLDDAGKGMSFLEDESINDYYRVQFTREVARGKPVGGGFRYSALGRAFFKVRDDDMFLDIDFFL